MRRNFLLASLLALAIVAGSAVVALAAPPVSGAVFTTDSTCTGVNINIFKDKADVYLDGGPSHPGAAGLPDGQYYVQVTEPGGAPLGTSLGTADDTPVIVKDGEFVDSNGDPYCYQLSAILINSNPNSPEYGQPGYDTISNPGGEYKVWVSNDPSFANDSTKTDNFKVKPQESGGPPPQAALHVRKFYDANANGVNDDGQLINGWEVRIKDNIDYVRFTPVNIIIDPDDYTVTEFSPVETNWMRTTANPVQVTLADGDDKTIEFGNLCLGAGGGFTLGFWSNNNGKAQLNDGGTMAPELALLSSLNLRNKNGTDFNPADFNGLKSWLLSADATNMAYMLSAQLAAMELNVEAGSVSGNALVYAPGATSANSLGYANITNLMGEANTELGAHAITKDGSPYRSYQQALKDALDKANNNLNFVRPTACRFTFAS